MKKATLFLDSNEGRIWSDHLNSQLLYTIQGCDKTEIIEKAKKWCFDNNYELEI